MIKDDRKPGELWVQAGFILTLVASLFLEAARFEPLMTALLGIGIVIIFLEVIKKLAVAWINVSFAEIILSLVIILMGGIMLFNTMSEALAPHHFFLLLLISGGLVTLVGTYKKLKFIFDSHL